MGAWMCTNSTILMKKYIRTVVSIENCTRESVFILYIRMAVLSIYHYRY